MSNIVNEYLKAHCIGPEQVEKFGLILCEDKISIPIKDKEGNVIFYKHRHFGDGPKYTYDKGSKIMLFNVGVIPNSRVITIVEGEMDAMAVHSREKGVAVSSTGGALSWQDEWSPLFQGKLVFICYDRDAAGAQGSYRVWNSLQPFCDTEILVLPSGAGKDISEFLGNGHNLILERLALPKKLSYRKGETKKAVKDSLKLCLENLNYLENSENRYLVEVFKTNIIEEIRALNKATNKMKYIPQSEGEDIKKIPITNFVQFHRGVTQCLFHDDRIPSMVYNDFNSNFPNTVKCFACGKFGSVIDVIMAQKSLSFKEAVNYLKSL